MRYINNDELHGFVSEDWLKRAKSAVDTLVSLRPDERSNFVRDNSKIWSELKEYLARLSHDKCWFSEVRSAELEIDHFRPKGRVSDTQIPHTGYWWLSFEWTNFRLATALVNKRRHDYREKNVCGKGCYFPLLDESTRVPDTEPHPINREKPKLLDPCIGADVQLLSYSVESGKIVERYRKDEHSTKHERARISIELYHLNDGTLIRDRRNLQVAIAFLGERVEQLSNLQRMGTISESQEAEYDSLLSQIASKISTSAPFCTFSRACLQQLGSLGWNDELLKSV